MYVSVCGVRARACVCALIARGTSRDIVMVVLKSLHAGLVDIVPHFDSLVITARDEIRFISTGVIADSICTFVVAITSSQREVRIGAGQAPHLDGAIKGGTGQ